MDELTYMLYDGDTGSYIGELQCYDEKNILFVLNAGLAVEVMRGNYIFPNYYGEFIETDGDGFAKKLREGI